MAKKNKTRRAAVKRFKVTGSGKVMRRKAYKGHLTAKKSPNRKRRLRKATVVSSTELKNVKNMIAALILAIQSFLKSLFLCFLPI